MIGQTTQWGALVMLIAIFLVLVFIEQGLQQITSDRGPLARMDHNLAIIGDYGIVCTPAPAFEGRRPGIVR